MPKSQTSCPRCQQPVLVDIQQVFDMGSDPLAKQKLLSNVSNTLQCPSCGFQGMVPVPIIYHDPDKELMLIKKFYCKRKLVIPHEILKYDHS